MLCDWLALRCVGQEEELWKHCSVEEKALKVLELLDDVSPLETLLAQHGGDTRFRLLSDDVQDVIRRCLTSCVSERPTSAQLLTSPAFLRCVSAAPRDGDVSALELCSSRLRCEHLQNPQSADVSDDLLSERSIDEVMTTKAGASTSTHNRLLARYWQKILIMTWRAAHVSCC